MKTLKLHRVTRYFGYILLATVLFTSCDKNAEVSGDSQVVNGNQTVKIDGREYIIYYHTVIPETRRTYTRTYTYPRWYYFSSNKVARKR